VTLFPGLIYDHWSAVPDILVAPRDSVAIIFPILEGFDNSGIGLLFWFYTVKRKKVLFAL